MAKIECPGCGAIIDTEAGTAELVDETPAAETPAETPAEESVTIRATKPATGTKGANRYRR